MNTATISHNIINNNYFEGINPVQSTNILIKRNTLSNNLQGIFLNQASNNIIKENHISGNSRGIEIRTSSNSNNIYHNNILNSVEDNGFDECTNTWDDGYPSGGNYWDDYNGYDNNGDGIGDIPYSIDGGSNDDNYPFMNQLSFNDPPQKPTNPSPANGTTGVSIYPSLSATVIDPDNNLLTVSFYNASDNSLIDQLTNVPSGTQPTIIWPNLAVETTYYWYVIADDGQFTNQSPTWHFSTGNQTNTPPSYPTIEGKKQGQANTEYTYTFTAEDPENQEIYYLIDWGDQTTSGWIGPIPSGQSIQESHTWDYGGYSIKAKTKDSEGAESDWSPVFPISMPKSQLIQIIQNRPILQKIYTFLIQFLKLW
jgi:parallel beta-helix repeat protein